MPAAKPQPLPVRCHNEKWQVLAGEGATQCWEDCRSEEDARLISQAELLYWELHFAPSATYVVQKLEQLATALERYPDDLCGE
jgi:hypothetical protein